MRHSALPKPGRVRELLELCSRLHGTRLARERPLWEAHLIEGLRDGRIAIYTKIHHALVDGVSAMRLLQSVMSTDPDKRDLPPPWAARKPAEATKVQDEEAEHSLGEVPVDAMRTALGITAEAAGLPGRADQDAHRGPPQRDLGALAVRAPHHVQHHDHRARAASPPRAGRSSGCVAIGKATGTTLNDVVLAMCSGAVRAYLLDHDALPTPRWSRWCRSGSTRRVPAAPRTRVATPSAP